MMSTPKLNDFCWSIASVNAASVSASAPDMSAPLV
jgi:hypothetical protein